jgi:hypothetical protein
MPQMIFDPRRRARMRRRLVLRFAKQKSRKHFMKLTRAFDNMRVNSEEGEEEEGVSGNGKAREEHAPADMGQEVWKGRDETVVPDFVWFEQDPDGMEVEL